MSPGDIARFERELFLQSAIDDVPLNDEMELPPLDADSMEHADLMERAIDYKQQQPSPSSMWLQQPHNSGKGGDSKMASSTFLKMHQPINQQKQHQKHHLSGDIAANANSDTLVPPPPPLPVAEPQRHCAIEISTKLTGVCQAMAPIGSACVAGDYMDVYNQDCL
ncbi:PREDICTED: uncharacterized protein LOC108373998 [Rhagoletis zephyria]|uniref:uncharacterized protein LOC108373998 n=1 Tax=Rhagoletis zephyria TaxID=28612 RepID=UPI000811813D|nr:PREDICTED: uncharacterized protein LOC108373998 [Rhagoletis zephyria]